MVLGLAMSALSLASLVVVPASGTWTPPPVVTIPPPSLPTVSMPLATAEWTPPEPTVYKPPAMPLATLAPIPTLVPLPGMKKPFDCNNTNVTADMAKNLSLEAVIAWVEEKRDWCCKHEQQGCTTTTTTSTVTTSTSTSSTDTTSTTTSSTLTETSTSTVDGCSLTFCSMQEAPDGNSTNATCRHHIQRLSIHMFLGVSGLCSKSRDIVLRQCDACSVCPSKLAGCGVLDYPSTSTTTTPRPCQSQCEVDGREATCEARIKWASTHYPFKGEPDACPRAHELVLKQCPSCAECGLEEAGCDLSPTLNEHVMADSYDCVSQLRYPRSQWSTQKRLWCCAHKKIGCHDTEAVRVLISDYNKDSQENHALAHGVWSTKVIVGVGAVGLVTAAAVLAIANRRPSQRGVEGYTNGVVMLKSVDDFIAE